MSYTSFGVNDAMAVKLWSKSLTAAEMEYLDIAPLMGEDENSIIQIKSETKKGAGDRVTFGLRARLQQDGKTENETAEGNGESLSIYSDSILINELLGVVAAKSENTIDAQRVPFDLRAQCKDGLGEWWAERKSVSFFNQVCGYTPATNLKFTGLNAVIAPSAGRKIIAGAAGDEQSLSTNNPFTLDLLDQAKEMAVLGANMVRPIKIGGQPKYVCYLHPVQVTSLRTNTSSAQWMDIQKAAMAGGEITKNPIFTGALGEYNGIILRQSQHVTQGVNSSTGAAITTVRRAVLLGAQSAVCAYGRVASGPEKYRWNEELLDHKRKLEVSATSIWGIKKVVFNSSDFGTVVIATSAVAAS